VQESCAICSGGLLARPAVQIEDFRLLICQACGSWTAMPRPTALAQQSFHDSDSYFDHPYLQHRRANPALGDRRCAAIFGRIGRALSLPELRDQRAVDIGCDTGEFILSAARQFGIQPVGLDVARRAVERAKAAGVEAYHCALENAPSHLTGLAAVTAIDVIEHIADPQAFFREVYCRLRPGGVIYAETPNVNSWVYGVGRRLCAWTGGRPLATFQRLFPEEHIQYFSTRGFALLANACGFDVPYLESRNLPLEEIAVGRVTRLALGALQGLDYLTGDGVLRWAILRRPTADAKYGW
jgi:2-polyprenyl-3-methyl-5-hydroxy-6-metoxy-1,4-benzoquinol methylase